jgi:hypothetical protein
MSTRRLREFTFINNLINSYLHSTLYIYLDPRQFLSLTMPPKVYVAPVDDNSPAAVQQRAHTTSIADFELPKTTLTKLAKGSVCLLSRL